MQDTRMGLGIKALSCMFTRCEIIGAAEVRVEGEVKEGSVRLANRSRLRAWIFGAEHTINQLLRVFDTDVDEMATGAAKAACIIYREPLYVVQIRANTEHYPSTTLAKLLA